MHFHGMYQIQFLKKMIEKSNAPIMSGFLGENLAGNRMRYLLRLIHLEIRYHVLFSFFRYIFGMIQELKNLFQFFN